MGPKSPQKDKSLKHCYSNTCIYMICSPCASHCNSHSRVRAKDETTLIILDQASKLSSPIVCLHSSDNILCFSTIDRAHGQSWPSLHSCEKPQYHKPLGCTASSSSCPLAVPTPSCRGVIPFAPSRCSKPLPWPRRCQHIQRALRPPP